MAAEHARPWATLPYLLGTVSSELYAPMLLCAVGPTALALAQGDLSMPGELWALAFPALTVLGIGMALMRALRTGQVLIYFHGGGYFSGAKSGEARLLLERLASRGCRGLR